MQRLNDFNPGKLNIRVCVIEFYLRACLEGGNFPWTTRSIPLLELLRLCKSPPHSLAGYIYRDSALDSELFHLLHNRRFHGLDGRQEICQHFP